MTSAYLLNEGQSMNRPPLFDGTNFLYWKTRMLIFLEATDEDYLDIIENGPREYKEKETKTSDSSSEEAERKRIRMLNSKAKNTLICGLAPAEYNKISSAKTAKEIWDRLITTYEGTDQVKESKVNTLIQKYEAFKMKNDETIGEMYDRFVNITNCLELLGRRLSSSELVRKLLRSLPKSWEAKRTAIVEAKDLTTLSLNELVGSLMAYEVEHAADDKKEKSIAFKASEHVLESSDNDSDEEMSEEFAMFVRKFSKHFYKNHFRNGRGSRRRESKSSDKKEVICFECKKHGHYRTECPNLKNKDNDKYSKKKKKAMVATWSENENESECEGEEANICFMANTDSRSSDSEDEVCDLPLSELSLDELQNLFKDLVSQMYDLTTKNKALKRQNKKLIAENSSLREEKSVLIAEADLKSSEAEKISAESEKKFKDAKVELDQLKSTCMEKAKCSDCLNKNGQKTVQKNDRRCQSVQKQKSEHSHRSRNNPSHASKCVERLCYYCRMPGHLVRYCQIKKCVNLGYTINVERGKLNRKSNFEWVAKT